VNQTIVSVEATHPRPTRTLVGSGVLQRQCACGQNTSEGEGEECKEKDRERKLQRATIDRSPVHEVPAIVHDVLLSPGQPLDATTRSSMEPRFGCDFSRVRVHSDTTAAESARRVLARAYTVGIHIVFRQGLYAPHTHEGQGLLAHELTHVVQQDNSASAIGASLHLGPTDDSYEQQARQIAAQPVLASQGRTSQLSNPAPTLQRDGEQTTRTDVAIVLDSDEQDMAEGRNYAQRVLRVTSAEDAKKQLKALGVPIGTLYVVSHSNSAGEVKFESGIGTLSWVRVSDLGKELKGALAGDRAPLVVDFRGCKLGEAGGQLESFRQQVGAKTAQATNCFSFTQRLTPLDIDGVDITQENQIPKGRERAFDAALRGQMNNMKAANGRRVKDCLIGLARGETADRNFVKIRQLYFRNGGNLIASWASPNYDETWQTGSICTKDMTESTNPCKIVKTTATGGSGKQGALEVEAPDTRLAGDTSEASQEEREA
jgi:hypothetical protein